MEFQFLGLRLLTIKIFGAHLPNPSEIALASRAREGYSRD